MEFVQNLPLFSIILALFSGPLCMILGSKWAKRVNLTIITVILAMSSAVLAFAVRHGDSYTYMMGHFPAPWGNEIRIGVLEALMAVFFCLVMLLCMIGGLKEQGTQMEKEKSNLYYVMVNLLLSSLLALIYTNDLFTAYVFVEINTISACGLIMIRQNGRTIEAATRYMIMSLLGSGLLLLGICFLYDLTGHLLMSNIKEQVQILYANGEYRVPLWISVCLMSIGIAIKSALYPFHTWVPDAYGYSTVSSAAILSSLVSKGYIFLLVKIFYRVIGFDIMFYSRIDNVLFVFGVIGMILGSVDAIRESNLRRMIAYSSVAQIGYIYMGFGLCTTAGIVASLYHIISHAATKALLFIAASGITDSCGDSTDFFDLTGAGYRNVLAGIAFTIGSLSMVGFPLLSGFISKFLFAQAAVGSGTGKLLPALIALAVSTLLNAVYFMKTVIRLYTPEKREVVEKRGFAVVRCVDQPAKSVALVGLIVLNVFLGLFSEPVVRLITEGLEMFA